MFVLNKPTFTTSRKKKHLKINIFHEKSKKLNEKIKLIRSVLVHSNNYHSTNLIELRRVTHNTNLLTHINLMTQHYLYLIL